MNKPLLFSIGEQVQLNLDFMAERDRVFVEHLRKHWGFDEHSIYTIKDAKVGEAEGEMNYYYLDTGTKFNGEFLEDEIIRYVAKTITMTNFFD